MPVLRRSRRPRLRGFSIRPGSVRQARLEAGLSLAELGAGHVTRSGIHQIETGRVQPSKPTLSLIAHRTGKPLDYFLVRVPAPLAADETGTEALKELERLTSTEDFAAAVELGRRLLRGRFGAHAEARIRFWLGQAACRLTQSVDGLADLRRARELFERLGDDWMVVECIDWEAAGLYAAQDAAALPLALDALARCRALQPLPVHTHLRILTHLAAIHVARHQWADAVARYEEALELSESLRDIKDVARLRDCLAIAYLETGEYDRAALHGSRALRVHRTLGDQAAIARTENNLGLVLMRQGDLDGAEPHLLASLGLARTNGLEAGTAHVLLSLAELALLRGANHQTHKFANDAIELAAELGERVTQATGYQILGRLAAVRGDAALVRAEFELAAGLLAEAGATEQLAECHYGCAAALEELDDPLEAIRHLRRAIDILNPSISRTTAAARSARPAASQTAS